MPVRIALLADRRVVLEDVQSVQVRRVRAPLVQEEHRLLQVGVIPRLPRQFHQRQLNFRMPIRLRPTLRPKRRADVIRRPHHDLEQPLRTGRPPVRHPRLDQVTHAIQLVLVVQVSIPPRRLGSTEVGIDVTVRTLRGPNQVDHLVNASL